MNADDADDCQFGIACGKLAREQQEVLQIPKVAALGEVWAALASQPGKGMKVHQQQASQGRHF